MHHHSWQIGFLLGAMVISVLQKTWLKPRRIIKKCLFIAETVDSRVKMTGHGRVRDYLHTVCLEKASKASVS